MDLVQSTVERLTARVRAEYREMPGLALTFRQACRLWHMEPLECVAVLRQLLSENFLYESARGAFIAAPGLAVAPADRPSTALIVAPGTALIRWYRQSAL